MKAHLVYAMLLASSLAAPVFAAPDSQQTVEQNKAVARKLFEVALNLQNWEIYNQLHSKDFVAHEGKYSGNLAEDLQSAKNWRLSFPDLKYSVDREIAEVERAIVIVAVAVSARIPSDGVKMSAELGQLVVPVGAVTADSMQENYQRARADMVHRDSWRTRNNISRPCRHPAAPHPSIRPRFQ